MWHNFMMIVSAVVAFQGPSVFAAETPPDRQPANMAERGAEPKGEDDEYGFSWLDPDKKVYVLQNRKYRKANHLAIFASGGINLTNPFKTEYVGVPRLGYWFSEQFGIEAFYTFVTNSDNATLTSLRSVSASALPFVREQRNYGGGLFTWTPWYAKMNFFNKILYFDWFFNAGVGTVSTALDQNRTANITAANYKYESFVSFLYGTGMDFYATRNFLVRLDLIGMAYSAAGPDGVTKRTSTTYDFTVGVGYIF